MVLKKWLNMAPILFLSVLLQACTAKTVLDIPMSWLEEEVVIEDIHQHYYDFCIAISKLSVYIDGEKHPIKRDCKLGSGNAFKHELKPGYKVFSFNSPKETWEGLAGRRGYALVINGVIVEVIVTTLS